MNQRYNFELLGPSQVPTRCSFPHYSCDPARYRVYLEQLQVLRGTAYLEDGAIKRSDLDGSGRFYMPGDERSWHLLLIEKESGAVIGCARYLLYPNTISFDELRISRSAIAMDGCTGPAIRRMIEADIATARCDGLGYVEVGGWAVRKEWRTTKAALDILAGSYALGELWGGCLGVCTATFRHGSASILRKFSGSTSSTQNGPFTVYYDPGYECPMEVLRFGYAPARRFAPVVDGVKQILRELVPVTCQPVAYLDDSWTIPLVA